MPRESWLALDNDDHDKFAAAMMLCQNASGWCVSAGRCFYDGDCFRSEFATYRQAARMIRKLAEKEAGMLQSALNEAAAHMETMAHAAAESQS